MTPEMATFLEKLRKTATTGIVGGSNLDKQRLQVGEDGTLLSKLSLQRSHKHKRKLLLPPPLAVLSRFDYVFSENGLVAYKEGQLIGQEVRGLPGVRRVMDHPRSAAHAHVTTPCALTQSIKTKFGDAKINEFTKYVLNLIASLDIPVMRYSSGL